MKIFTRSATAGILAAMLALSACAPEPLLGEPVAPAAPSVSPVAPPPSTPVVPEPEPSAEPSATPSTPPAVDPMTEPTTTEVPEPTPTLVALLKLGDDMAEIFFLGA